MKEIEQLVKQMTLEEKASLCSGKDFWYLKGLDRLDIPSIMVTDGPHGLRKQAGEADHVGLNESVPATCFPTASALAATRGIRAAAVRRRRTISGVSGCSSSSAKRGVIPSAISRCRPTKPRGGRLHAGETTAWAQRHEGRSARSPG